MAFATIEPPGETEKKLQRSLFELGEHIPRGEEDDDQEGEILSAIRTGFLERITDEPFCMSPETVGACLIWGHKDVHGRRYCDVFMTAEAIPTIRSGEGKYAEGTVIVKAKYPDQNRESKIELYTVMRKMPEGYAPDFGNWEFSVVDGDADYVLARGKISSCVECHMNYAATDFVTRTYMNKPRLDDSRL